MTLLKTLRVTEQDVDTVRQALKAGIQMNTSLLGLVKRWFSDVEIVYPIAEMPMADDEKTELATTILGEMTELARNAIAALEAGADEEDVEKAFATSADAGWRELAGVFSELLNEQFRETAAEVDPEEFIQGFRAYLEAVAEATGLSIEEARSQALKSPSFRTQLRDLGIDPDSI